MNFPVDMNRTFPDNVKFRKSADPCLQNTLYNVLLAYGRHNQAVGYCQVSAGKHVPAGKAAVRSRDILLGRLSAQSPS